MQRRTLIASLGTLFVAGCAGAPSNESPSDNSTGNESTSGDASAPEPQFNFESKGEKTVRVVHMGGENVTDKSTKEVYVTVGGERAVTWVSDASDKGEGSYPLSIGNFVEVEAANGDKIEVVWVSQSGTEQTLATHTVEASNTTTPSGNETSSGNESSTGNQTTTAGAETTATGNETASGK